MESKIITEFLGKINRIIFIDEEVYDFVNEALEILENILGKDITSTNIVEQLKIFYEEARTNIMDSDEGVNYRNYIYFNYIDNEVRLKINQGFYYKNWIDSYNEFLKEEEWKEVLEKEIKKIMGWE